MIRKNKWKLIIGSLVILIPVVVGLLLWDQLPDRIVTHFGVDGQPDGWSSKTVAVLLLPCLLLVIHWVGVLVMEADPKGKNQNPKPMALMFWVCPVLSLLTGRVTLGSALGLDMQIGTAVMLFLGAMFAFIGNYMPKCKPNYTMGIKLPWTLHSEKNWVATHRFGGKVWLAGGILLLVCAFLPEQWALISGAVIALPLVAAPTLYSWHYYRKYEKP